VSVLILNKGILIIETPASLLAHERIIDYAPTWHLQHSSIKQQ